MERIALDTSLLPDYLALQKDVVGEFSVGNFIELRATHEVIAALAHIFWPDFVQVQGCIIRKDAFNRASFQRWWEHTNGDTREIERVLNLVHIYDLSADASVLDKEIYQFIGQSLAAMWSARVAKLFPDRDFVCAYEDVDENGGEVEPTVYLYQGAAHPRPV